MASSAARPAKAPCVSASATYLGPRQTLAPVPEDQVRFRFRRDSVAIFDNRCTQHYAVQDFHPAVRRLERAGIIGDKPH